MVDLLCAFLSGTQCWWLNACSQNLKRCITHIVLELYYASHEPFCLGFKINSSAFFFLYLYRYICLTRMFHTSIYIVQKTETSPCWQSAALLQFLVFFQQEKNQRCTSDRDTQTEPDKISPASQSRQPHPKPTPFSSPNAKYKRRLKALKLLTVSTTM